MRIDPAYGPFAAARDQGDEAQAALAATLRDGSDSVWLVERAEWPAPRGTRVVRTAPLVQMVAENPVPMRPGDEVAVMLGDADIPAMTELALATEPGPWGPRTAHYGAFYGIKRDGKLLAMAGERMLPAPGFDEVSGVCTWPEFQGQGLAAKLIRRVMAGIAGRGAVPFLHSYAGNARAIGLYESLGFRIRAKMVVTVLALT
ncbi:MAG: GNAT family N-acetyltransferase [Sphingomonadales bacterium]|nr:GNAT family N-acetyltransferase [Sphingomonadales bacterium]